MLEMNIDFERQTIVNRKTELKAQFDKNDLIFKSSSEYILCRGL